MIDEFKYHGYWWLPSSPEKVITGTLSYSLEHGIVLEILGSFDGIPFINRNEWEIILGENSKGNPVTLHKNYLLNSAGHFPSGHPVTQIRSQQAFDGIHFADSQSIKFKSLYVGLTHLEDWLNRRAFEFKYDHTSKTTTILHTEPESIPFIINDKIKAELRYDWSGPKSSVVQKEATIRRRARLKIEAIEDLNFGDMMTIISQIQSLLALATITPIYVISLSGQISKNNQKADIYLLLNDRPDLTKEIHPNDMLFCFADISNNLQEHINRWFNKYSLLKSVFDLYFAIVYNKQLYGENKFLSLSQALESYHRKAYGGVYQQREMYLQNLYPLFIGAIPENVEKDYKSSLKTKLKYMNEYSLRKRLKELFLLHQNVFSLYIKNSDQAIEDIVNTRNYLTHYDDSIKHLSKEGEALLYLSERMKFIFEAILLGELGIPEDKIRTIFQNNQKYSFLLRAHDV